MKKASKVIGEKKCSCHLAVNGLLIRSPKTIGTWESNFVSIEFYNVELGNLILYRSSFTMCTFIIYDRYMNFLKVERDILF